MSLLALWLNLLPVALPVALAGALLYLLGRDSLRARIAARARAEVNRRQATADPRRGIAAGVRAASLKQLLATLGQRLPVLRGEPRAEIMRTLVAAGYRSPQAVAVVSAILLIFTLGFALLPLFIQLPLVGDSTPLRLLACLVGAYLGGLLPRLVLDRLSGRRQRRIAEALPDALDLLLVCTNAGMGLEVALQRVADELLLIHPELADELRLTVAELRVSSDVDAVFEALARRTRVKAMRTLVTVLIQSRRFGTPITRALRVLASGERTARRMRLEEAAATLSVKMTMPMMLFILPTVLIVSAGPAVLGLIRFFATM